MVQLMKKTQQMSCLFTDISFEKVLWTFYCHYRDHIFPSALYVSILLPFGFTTCFFADCGLKPLSCRVTLLSLSPAPSFLMSDRTVGCMLPRLRGRCHSAVSVSLSGCQLAGQ